ENAEAADNAAKSRMKQKQPQGQRQVAQEIVLFPEIRPGQIKEKGAHLQAKHDQNDAKRFIHERESAPGRMSSASGLLKRSDAVRSGRGVNVTPIALGKPLKPPLDTPRRFLGHA